MDAYSSYIMQSTEHRLGELRREAAEYRLSQSARGARRSWWSRVGNAFRRRPVPVIEPLAALSLATLATDDGALRRSA